MAAETTICPKCGAAITGPHPASVCEGRQRRRAEWERAAYVERGLLDIDEMLDAAATEERRRT